MFDDDFIKSLLSLLTASEKLLLTSFVEAISEQAQHKNNSLILQVGWQGADLIKEDFVGGIDVGNVGVNQGDQVTKVNTRGLRKLS